MAKHFEKTNAMRILDAANIEYRFHSFEDSDALSGMEVAKLMGFEPERVFKTLVTVGKSGDHFVFMIPAPDGLDLKKAAQAVGEKSIAMIKSKELFALTGYVHGGCSPIGMKKQFRTTVDETAELFDDIVFSAGRIGVQIETSWENLAQVVPLTTADLTI